MKAKENLDRIEIVLCRPMYSGNIGAVCRAMKTMGLTHLAIVPSSEPDTVYDETQIKTYAIHAYDVYENRRTCATLSEALKDSVLSIACTRRRGKSRKLTSFTPEETAEKISSFGDGKVSVVFGCEADGLSDEEVRLCSEVLTIPTSPAFPSLNLSQAVQIVCYTLFTRLKEYPSGGFAINKERADDAAKNCTGALKELKYFKVEDEERFTEEFLRDVFMRASLSEGEVQRMEKIFSKTRSIALHKNKVS